MYEGYYYTDASTKNNGKLGQDSNIVVTDEFGQVVFEKHLGDYTINEAELLGVIACFERIAPHKRIKVFTDSMIVKNWLMGRLTEKKKKKWKVSERTKRWVEITRAKIINTQSLIEWLPRNKNLAGHVFEGKDAQL